MKNGESRQKALPFFLPAGQAAAHHAFPERYSCEKYFFTHDLCLCRDEQSGKGTKNKEW